MEEITSAVNSNATKEPSQCPPLYVLPSLVYNRVIATSGFVVTRCTANSVALLVIYKTGKMGLHNYLLAPMFTVELAKILYFQPTIAHDQWTMH